MSTEVPSTFFFAPEPKLSLPCVTVPIKLSSKKKNGKGPTLREQQVAYWSKRDPVKGFETLTLCLFRLDLIRFVAKDIRKILFDLIVVCDPPFFKTNERKKFRLNHDLVFDRCINIPKGTLNCVHISLIVRGRDCARYRLAFSFTDKNLADFIIRTENSLSKSKSEELYPNFKKSVIENRNSLGWSLFYDFTVTDMTDVLGEVFVGEYNKTDKISLLKHSWCNNHKVCLSRPTFVETGKIVDFPIRLVITGLVNIKPPRRGPDKPFSNWSRLAYRLDV